MKLETLDLHIKTARRLAQAIELLETAPVRHDASPASARWLRASGHVRGGLREQIEEIAAHLIAADVGGKRVATVEEAAWDPHRDSHLQNLLHKHFEAQLAQQRAERKARKAQA